VGGGSKERRLYCGGSQMMKIHLNIPPSLFNKMEEIVLEKGITRTAFVIAAIRRYVFESKSHAKKPDEDTS
jgi:metal-responsive CopG/Arc/MetJ family transcriptional regulator